MLKAIYNSVKKLPQQVDAVRGDVQEVRKDVKDVRGDVKDLRDDIEKNMLGSVEMMINASEQRSNKDRLALANMMQQKQLKHTPIRGGQNRNAMSVHTA